MISCGRLRVPSLSGFLGLFGLTPVFGESGVFDWEESVGCSSTHIQNGIVAENSRGTICLTTGPQVHNGTVYSRDVSGLTLRHRHGLPFTPLHIDLAEYSGTVAETSLTFTGRTADGESVTTTFTLDGERDGPGGEPDFQTFEFPARFADLLELSGPDLEFSCDNFVFDTIIPPPLPADPGLPQGFGTTVTIHSRTLHDDHFLIGEDFAYASGFSVPTRAKFLGVPGGRLFSVSLPWLDPASRVLFYGSGDSLFTRTPSEIKQAVTLEEVTAAGFPATSLSRLRPVGDGYVFLAFDFQGSDGFRILEKSAGEIRERVGPDTVLPLGDAAFTPHRFPRFLTTWGSSLAFDTSLDGSASTVRIYAGFEGDPPELIASEDEPLDDDDPSLGELLEILAVDLTAESTLALVAETSTGRHCIIYRNGPQPESALRLGPLAISPVNTGKRSTAYLIPTPHDSTLAESFGGRELFRRSAGQWYRLIGVGDRLGGRTISHLKYLARPENPPQRVIVDVRFDDDASISHNIELVLASPLELAPRISRVTRPPSGHVFLTLDRLTSGRDYLLKQSSDLAAWHTIGPIEVMPAQNLLIEPEDARARKFYRVEEAPAAPESR